jgi:hypothetical protein
MILSVKKPGKDLKGGLCDLSTEWMAIDLAGLLAFVTRLDFLG